MKTINPPQAHKDRHTVLSVVVSYNFMRWIDKCLPSLLQSEEPTDVLVIDNASTDEGAVSAGEIDCEHRELRLRQGQ